MLTWIVYYKVMRKTHKKQMAKLWMMMSSKKLTIMIKSETYSNGNKGEEQSSGSVNSGQLNYLLYCESDLDLTMILYNL